jgi:hypothetical protein
MQPKLNDTESTATAVHLTRVLPVDDARIGS